MSFGLVLVFGKLDAPGGNFLDPLAADPRWHIRHAVKFLASLEVIAIREEHIHLAVA